MQGSVVTWLDLWLRRASTLHSKSRVLGPAEVPMHTPHMQRAGGNGSSGQAATKATTTAPIQSLFSEKNSENLSGECTETAASLIHHQADKGSPQRLIFMKYNSDSHV